IASLTPVGGSLNAWSLLNRMLSLSSILPTGSQTLAFRLYGYNGLGWMVDSVRIYDASHSPLPITLTSFTGRQEGDDVTLGWSTASEENSNYFRVLQSSDMENWKEVGMVSSAGFSN